MNALTNKVAIVTGASSGIGHAAAKLFAQEGAKVVVAARRKAELSALVAEIVRAGGKAVALAGDVKEEAFAKALAGDSHRAPSAGWTWPSTTRGQSGPRGRRWRVTRYAGWEDTVRDEPDQRLLDGEIPDPRHDQGRRRCGRVHLDVRGPHGRLPEHGGVRGEQGRPHRSDANPGNGVRDAAGDPVSTPCCPAAPTRRWGGRGPRPRSHSRTHPQLARAENIATPEEDREVRSTSSLTRRASTTGIALLADGGISINRS